MASRVAVLALAASALLLAACAAAPAEPPGLSEAEVRVLIDEQNARWWEAIAPGEPRPVVEPIEYVRPGDEGQLVEQCLVDAEIEGVRVTAQGGIDYGSIGPESNDAFNRASYVCAMRYPYDISDPESMGFFSDAQLGYIYDYFAERSVPCLRMLGFSVPNPPARQQFVDDYYVNGWWTPYYPLTPGMDERGWGQVQLYCPPPALFGELYMPYP